MVSLNPASGVFLALLAIANGAVWNNDARYTNWNVSPGAKDRNGQTNIPVFLEDAAYRADAVCSQSIRDAITAMNTDLTGCVNFKLLTTPTPTTIGQDFVWISSKFNNGTESDTCLSMPGRNPLQNKQGQKLYIKGNGANKPGHCCANPRGVMRFLAHTLGMRNEFNRVDRDNFLKVTPANIDPTVASYSMYAKLTSGKNLGRFDIKSITMVDKLDNAQATKTMFEPVATTAPGNVIGNLPKLSAEDCFQIKSQYGCDTMTLPCDTDAYP